MDPASQKSKEEKARKGKKITMRWCVRKINEGETQLQEARNTARRQEPKEGGV